MTDTTTDQPIPVLGEMLAEDLAPCPSGCGCITASDPDSRDCACDGPCTMCDTWPIPLAAERDWLRSIAAAAYAWRHAQRAMDQVLGGRPMDPVAYSAARPTRDAALRGLNTALDTNPQPGPGGT